jgi:hypothetical protein
MGSYGADFVKEFFKRTLYNLKCYDTLHKEDPEKYPNNVTQLINSFLGLLIFVKEDNINLSDRIYENFKNKKMEWTYAEDKNTKAFIRHLRNAIGHRRIIEKTNKQNEIIGLNFKDQKKQNKKIYKFEIDLSVKEIRKIIDLIDKDMKSLEEKLNANIC